VPLLIQWIGLWTLFLGYSVCLCLQCFDAIVGQQEGHSACKTTGWWDAGMVICLERGADLHMALLIPLPLTVSCFNEIQIGLPSWY